MHRLRSAASVHTPAQLTNIRHSCVLLRRITSRARAAAVTQHISAQVPEAAVPQHIRTQLSEAAVDWSQHCLTEPLVDQVTGCKVYLFGVSHYAPGQQQQLHEVIQQLQPSCIALDVPPDALPGVLLPYPAWIQTLLDHAHWLDPAAAAAAAADLTGAAAVGAVAVAAHNNGNGTSSHGVETSAGKHPATTADHGLQQQQQRQQQLYTELAAVAAPDAKIGRDILDPFEGLGYYAGVDYSRSPAHIAIAWQDLGFAPGWELAAAAKAALAQGARLACLDAPLRLQESWVKGLLQSFVVDEQGYAYQPRKDLEEVQALVSPALVTWDAELAAKSAAEAASRLADQQSHPAASNGDGSGVGSVLGSPEERALVRFKVSKATAAAALTVDQTAQALTALRRLQPLKFKHAALRELHMSRQLRDVCCRLATAAGVMPSVVTEVTPESAGSGSSSSSSSGGEVASRGGADQVTTSPAPPSQGAELLGQPRQPSGAGAAVGDSPLAPVVLAVVGRQYVPGMQALWQQPDSALWRDVMPKDFTPTQLTWELAAQQHGHE